ncbi:lysophospholipid acyltransferase family protein [Tistrella mobilis]|jgi:1-acyl-sn-glycerol-3-phosphate acyltransferase|uniref:Acyl-phosphate glycerol 3-phosphate acyltransferase n=1 Tax=Tistrella mobilis TaxID=171437 RepID=A0A162KZE7_9PROT|nr:lysophospholipid acyltransferase family protein [Tistrella mobilis]KYO52521.1 acyl-phosphate glycerol 3-phosphate acyltransferase [Tistrella mobilis]
MTGWLRAAVLLPVYLAVTAALIPVQAALVALKLPGAVRFPRFYHRLTCRLIGFDVDVVGTPVRDRPALFVSNHSSYLDISVLGSVIAGSFIAKSEVADWPLYGLLAKLQRTVFVKRERSRTAEQADEVARRLEAGDRLILFPEGTSNDGQRVLPFRTAFFSVADRRPGGRPLVVQPVSLAYTHVRGMPMGRKLRPAYAWYGDMDLAGHLWTALTLGPARVELVFHPPVTIDDFKDRKALARHCEQAVSAGVAQALQGRSTAALALIGHVLAQRGPAVEGGALQVAEEDEPLDPQEIDAAEGEATSEDVRA